MTLQDLQGSSFKVLLQNFLAFNDSDEYDDDSYDEENMDKTSKRKRRDHAE